MAHDCIQDERVRELQKNAEGWSVEMKQHKESISKLEKFQDKITWGIVFILLTLLGQIALLIAQRR